MTYNLFFYANACHVCKSFGTVSRLKRCGRCRMISYCCKDHQKQHWPQHKHICNTVRDILDNENGCSSLRGTFEESDSFGWSHARTDLMLLTNIKIGRQLETYEKQMFLFPRACAVCHSQNFKVLTDCQNCPNASFCDKHINNSAHKRVCSLFKLCFDLDRASVLWDQQPPRLAVSIQTKRMRLPDNLKEFFDHYCSLIDALPLNGEVRVAYISEYLTRPLTLLYAMEKLGSIWRYRTINIHIVGANMIELAGLEIWELLLHWLPDLRTTKIMLIGPELPSGSIAIRICQECLERQRRIDFEICPMVYDEYIRHQSFIQPDLVIGYNAGIHACENVGSNYDTWFPFVRLLTNQACPFVLTAYTKREAIRERDRLKEILDDRLICRYSSENPFSGLRPYRDYETEQLYYQNNYIMIYVHS